MNPGLAVVTAGALLLGTFGAGTAYESHRWEAKQVNRQREIDSTFRASDSIIAALRAKNLQLASQHAVDTVTYLQWKDRWRTLIDTLHDTVTVERVIEVAKEGLAKCESSWRSCELLRANLTADRDSLASQVRTLKTPIVSPPARKGFFDRQIPATLMKLLALFGAYKAGQTLFAK